MWEREWFDMRVNASGVGVAYGSGEIFYLLGLAKWAWEATVGDRGRSRGTDSLGMPSLSWETEFGRSAEGDPLDGA